MTSFDMEFAPGWRPEEGELIIGKVTELSRNWSNQSRSWYPIITIVKEDGNRVAIHAFHTALKNKIMELRPQIGETIGCQFVGKRPQKNDPTREVAVYGFKVKGRTADIYALLDEPTAPQATPTVPVPRSDIPADTSDFAPQASAVADDDDIPF